MTVAISGQQYEIRAGALRAVITEAGAGLRQLHHGDLPLVDGFAADEQCPGAHGQLLVPWPNRVDGGRYIFNGERHQLDITEPAGGNAIHGLVRWAAWELREQDENRAELAYRLHGQPGYPYVLDVTASYTLHSSTDLVVWTSATNVGSQPAPYGYGAHPYLTVGRPTIDDCLLTIPAATRLPIDDRDIPTGREPVAGTPYDFLEPRRVGDVWLNHAYTDLTRDANGRAWTRLESPSGETAVSLWVDESFGWLQLFTGDDLPQPERRRTGLAVEPMSCPPNAFATGEDVVILEPGETAAGAWGIRCELG